MRANLKKLIFDALFPPICIGCKKDLDESAALLCEICQNTLIADPALHCSVCRRRLPFSTGGLPNSSNRCHPGGSHLIFSAGRYEHEVIRALIWHLKFKHRTQAAAYLSKLISQALISANILLPDYTLTSIPLSDERLRKRGFNQAALIAKGVGLAHSLPTQEMLLRIKNSTPQSELASWDERRVNIADSFRLCDPLNVQGKKIVVIDDVWTSGATMSEAAAILKKHGAAEVLAVVVARAK